MTLNFKILDSVIVNASKTFFQRILGFPPSKNIISLIQDLESSSGKKFIVHFKTQEALNNFQIENLQNYNSFEIPDLINNQILKIEVLENNGIYIINLLGQQISFGINSNGKFLPLTKHKNQTLALNFNGENFSSITLKDLYGENFLNSQKRKNIKSFSECSEFQIQPFSYDKNPHYAISFGFKREVICFICEVNSQEGSLKIIPPANFQNSKFAGGFSLNGAFNSSFPTMNNVNQTLYDIQKFGLNFLDSGRTNQGVNMAFFYKKNDSSINIGQGRIAINSNGLSYTTEKFLSKEMNFSFGISDIKIAFDKISSNFINLFYVNSNEKTFSHSRHNINNTIQNSFNFSKIFEGKVNSSEIFVTGANSGSFCNSADCLEFYYLNNGTLNSVGFPNQQWIDFTTPSSSSTDLLSSSSFSTEEFLSTTQNFESQTSSNPQIGSTSTQPTSTQSTLASLKPTSAQPTKTSTSSTSKSTSTQPKTTQSESTQFKSTSTTKTTHQITSTLTSTQSTLTSTQSTQPTSTISKSSSLNPKTTYQTKISAYTNEKQTTQENFITSFYPDQNSTLNSTTDPFLPYPGLTNKNNNALIIGGSLIGSFGLIALILAYFHKKRRSKRKTNDIEMQTDNFNNLNSDDDQTLHGLEFGDPNIPKRKDCNDDLFSIKTDQTNSTSNSQKPLVPNTNQKTILEKLSGFVFGGVGNAKRIRRKSKDSDHNNQDNQSEVTVFERNHINLEQIELKNKKQQEKEQKLIIASNYINDSRVGYFGNIEQPSSLKTFDYYYMLEVFVSLYETSRKNKEQENQKIRQENLKELNYSTLEFGEILFKNSLIPFAKKNQEKIEKFFDSFEKVKKKITTYQDTHRIIEIVLKKYFKFGLKEDSANDKKEYGDLIYIEKKFKNLKDFYEKNKNNPKLSDLDKKLQFYEEMLDLKKMLFHYLFFIRIFENFKRFNFEENDQNSKFESIISSFHDLKSKSIFEEKERIKIEDLYMKIFLMNLDLSYQRKMDEYNKKNNNQYQYNEESNNEESNNEESNNEESNDEESNDEESNDENELDPQREIQDNKNFSLHNEYAKYHPAIFSEIPSKLPSTVFIYSKESCEKHNTYPDNRKNQINLKKEFDFESIFEILLNDLGISVFHLYILVDYKIIDEIYFKKNPENYILDKNEEKEKYQISNFDDLIKISYNSRISHDDAKPFQLTISELLDSLYLEGLIPDFKKIINSLSRNDFYIKNQFQKICLNFSLQERINFFDENLIKRIFKFEIKEKKDLQELSKLTENFNLSKFDKNGSKLYSLIPNLYALYVYLLTQNYFTEVDFHEDEEKLQDFYKDLLEPYDFSDYKEEPKEFNDVFLLKDLKEEDLEKLRNYFGIKQRTKTEFNEISEINSQRKQESKL